MALFTQVREAGFAPVPEGGSPDDEEDVDRREECPSSPTAAELCWALERSLVNAHEAGVDLLAKLGDAFGRQG